MGQIFYDMGLLATAEVVESSATDLVGQYVGHTGPKTGKLLEKALGKVLFIDEAYRLADGAFGKEAMDELVDCLTKPKYCQKLVTILAGYDDDINRLMSSNPGLTSRFPETVSFANLTPEQCWKLFQNCLRIGHIDSNVVQNPRVAFKDTILEFFKLLSKLPAWGNARDVQTVAKVVTGKVLSNPTEDGEGNFVVTEKVIESVFRSTTDEREHRARTASAHSGFLDKIPAATAPPLNSLTPAPPVNTQKTTNAQAVQATPPPESSLSQLPLIDQDEFRDPGISDEVWAQLQSDRKEMEKREQQDHELLAREQFIQHQLAESISEDSGEGPDDEEQRKYEELLRSIAREKIEIEERKKREEAAQKKLQEMGVCPVGFRWIKQAAGYRCAGGSHFVSNTQLA